MKALNDNLEAKKIFNNLAPSKQFEIVRYIAALKTEASVDKNIIRAIDFYQAGDGLWAGIGPELWIEIHFPAGSFSCYHENDQSARSLYKKSILANACH